MTAVQSAPAADSDAARIKVTHIITGLGRGGAERTLERLLPTLQAAGIDGRVIALGPEGPVGDTLRAQGFDVHALDGAGRATLPVRLLQSLRRAPGDLVQTWMYHADLLGALAALGAGRPPVVWNVRHTDPRQTDLAARTRAIARLCARLSARLPAHVLCCGEQALAQHAALGYERTRMSVLYNGFDTDRFRRDVQARAELRARWQLAQDELVIGVAARWHPHKGHTSLLKAVYALRAQQPELRLALCGEGITDENRELRALLEGTGLDTATLLLGERDDMPAFWNAVDIGCSPSIDEGLPNALGEAMASGLPCVSTDAGDSAALLGDCGYLVPRGNPDALHDALGAVTALDATARAEMGGRARSRICEQFSLRSMGDAYAAFYRQLIAPPPV
ncbi:MAG: glycosyltransferase [Pseudomonadota bacterium]